MVQNCESVNVIIAQSVRERYNQNTPQHAMSTGLSVFQLFQNTVIQYISFYDQIWEESWGPLLYCFCCKKVCVYIKSPHCKSVIRLTGKIADWWVIRIIIWRVDLHCYWANLSREALELKRMIRLMKWKYSSLWCRSWIPHSQSTRTL